MIGSRDYHPAYVEECEHEHYPAHAEHLAGDAHGGQGAAGDAHVSFLHGAHDRIRVGGGKEGKTQAEEHEIRDYEPEARPLREEDKTASPIDVSAMPMEATTRGSNRSDSLPAKGENPA